MTDNEESDLPAEIDGSVSDVSEISGKKAHYFKVTYPDLYSGQDAQEGSIFDFLLGEQGRLFSDIEHVDDKPGGLSFLSRIRKKPHGRYVHSGLVTSEEMLDALVEGVKSVPGCVVLDVVKNAKTGLYEFRMSPRLKSEVDESMNLLAEYGRSLSLDLKWFDKGEPGGVHIEKELGPVPNFQFQQYYGRIQGRVETDPVDAFMARKKVRKKYGRILVTDSLSIY
ncbi:MAG: hypothetical protein JSV63_00125 [Candidatus Aenigmatarchaeota archaeon]|nr:MAG: hypothetical protein JSV63_00125 [Candidatus Aenigmarchaeota archaeon]